MARYTAFSADLLAANPEIAFVEANFTHIEGENIQANDNFSVIKNVDATVAKLR